MKLFGKNPDNDVAIVAEIGVNHEGSLDKALRLIGMAADAGADAVKLTMYSPLGLWSASRQDRLKRAQAFCLSPEDLLRCRDEAEKRRVPIFCTAATADVVPWLADFFPAALKIASGDLTFFPTVEAAAKTSMPVILSTGAGSLEEIEKAIAVFAAAMPAGDSLRDRLMILHCVSLYPTRLLDANVRSIPFLAKETGLRIGYSCHVPFAPPAAGGEEACLSAVALGACMLEVHFTDCLLKSDFRDHALSIEQAGLRVLKDKVLRTLMCLGELKKERAVGEDIFEMRKGLTARRSLPAGHVIGAGDLGYARPATEFPWFADIIGKKLVNDVALGHSIPRSAIAGSAVS